MRTRHKHIYLIMQFLLSMHLSTPACACKSSLLLPSSLNHHCSSQVLLSLVLCEVWEDCVSVFCIFTFSCIIFPVCFFKVFFHKKGKQKIYQKERYSCFVCCKFLLINGTDNRTGDTEQQSSWLINTNYTWCEKEVKNLSMLHSTVTAAVLISRSSLGATNKQTKNKSN